MQVAMSVLAESQGKGGLIPAAPPRLPLGTSQEGLPFQRDLLPGVQLVLFNKHHWGPLLPPPLPSGMLPAPVPGPLASVSGPQITCSIRQCSESKTHPYYVYCIKGLCKKYMKPRSYTEDDKQIQLYKNKMFVQ